MWGAGGGETVRLAPNTASSRDSIASAAAQGIALSLPQKLQVDVMDKDIKGSDFIGRHTVDLEQVADKEGGSFDEDWCAEGWYGLKDDKGAATGEVRLVLRWAVPALPEVAKPAGEHHGHLHNILHHSHGQEKSVGAAASPGGVPPVHEDDMPHWELQTTIMECADLPKMDRFGKNDVYATVNVEGVQTLRTATAEDAGSTPEWKDGDGLLAHVLGTAPAALGIRVFDEDVGSADDIIGTAVVPLGPALHYSDGARKQKGLHSTRHHSTRVEWEMPPTWLELTAPNAKHGDKSAGRVRIQISWKLAASAELVQPTRPWTPEQAHFWATDPSRLLEEVDSFLYEPTESTESAITKPADEPEVASSDDADEAAATKIQAVQRGRQGRKKATQKKKTARENSAATKIQARQRGRKTRQKLGSKPGTTSGGSAKPPAEPCVSDEQEMDSAATKIQAHTRGRQGRKKAKQKKQTATAKPRQQENAAKADIDSDDARRDAVVAIPSAADYDLEPEPEPEPEPAAGKPVAEEQAPETDIEALREELQDLKLAALRVRASKGGASEDQIATALADAEVVMVQGGEAEEVDEKKNQKQLVAEQKAALIELIMDQAEHRLQLAAIARKGAEVEAMDHGLEKAEALIKLKEEQRAAAVKIQARARGRAERKRYQAMVAKREAAATRIQSVARGRADRERLRADGRLHPNAAAAPDESDGAQSEAEAARQARLAEMAPPGEASDATAREL